MKKLVKQSDISFDELSQMIYQHLKERDWLTNTSRSLATSIVLESSELLEHYQWQEKAVGDKDALGEELADIFIYAIEFAQNEGIDIPAVITKKLQTVAKKYPAKNFKDKNLKDKNDAWFDAKLKHKKKGL